MARFKSFDHFLEEVPREVSVQFAEARAIIHRLMPRIEEGIKYSIPFFLYQGLFIYFSVHAKKRYFIGFCQGSKMQDELGLLKADENQQFIRHWELFPDKPFNRDVFGAYVLEAEALQQKQRPFSKK